MTWRLAMLLMVLAVLPCGCITKHAGVPEPERRWTVGVTTCQEVVAKWGNPHKVAGETWVWRDWNLTGSKVKAAYMMIGFTISNAAVSTREHRLIFNADGRLVSHDVVDSVPGGAEWSMWPW